MNFLTLILLAVAIAVGVYLVSNPQVLKSRADFAPVQTTSNVKLSLSPVQGTANRNCDFSLKVLLDAGSQTTAISKVSIKYDQTRLEAVSVENADFSLSEVDISDKITFSVINGDRIQGKATLAKLQFRVLANAPDGLANVIFDTAEKYSVENGTYIIGDNACKVLQ